MLKNAYFLEKTAIIASASRVMPPNPRLPPTVGGFVYRPPRFTPAF